MKYLFLVFALVFSSCHKDCFKSELVGEWVDQFERVWIFNADGHLRVSEQVETSEILLYLWTPSELIVYGNEIAGEQNIWTVSTAYVIDYLKEEKNEIWFNMTARQAVMPMGIKLKRE